MFKKILLTLTLALMVGFSWFHPTLALAQTNTSLPIMSAEELAKHNGQAGNKAYFAYEGLVYDVTDSKSWKLGKHFGVEAGKDLTGFMEGAPHGTEVFKGFEVVATYGSDATITPDAAESTKPVAATTADPTAPSTSSPKWYEGRIKIFGLSILGWSGILLGVTFVLNFATCFALPWTKLPLPWKGSKPGADALDGAESHLHWGALHKHFAWLTVVFGILHGILGFLQMMGYYL